MTGVRGGGKRREDKIGEEKRGGTRGKANKGQEKRKG